MSSRWCTRLLSATVAGLLLSSTAALADPSARVAQISFIARPVSFQPSAAAAAVAVSPTPLSVAVETPAPTVHHDVAVFGGYAWSRPTTDDVHISLGDALHAWIGGVAVPIGRGVSLVGDVEGAYGAQFSTGIVVRPTGTVRSSLYAVEAGPRFRPSHWRVAPYGEARLGVIHAQARSMGVDFLQAVTDTACEVGGEGGIDVRLTPSLGFDTGVSDGRSNLFGQRFSRVRVVSTLVWIR